MKYYVGFTKNNEIRLNSSSGGIFYELASEVLKKSGVVFGVAWDKNWEAHYIGIGKIEELPLLMGSKYVLLSLGQSGAILTDGKEHLYCRSANVAVNSTVGAGDSMIAAASLMIEAGKSMEEVLRSAVAAGTASITTPGTNLFYKDKYQEIYERIYVEKLI